MMTVEEDGEASNPQWSTGRGGEEEEEKSGNSRKKSAMDGEDTHRPGDDQKKTRVRSNSTTAEFDRGVTATTDIKIGGTGGWREENRNFLSVSL